MVFVTGGMGGRGTSTKPGGIATPSWMQVIWATEPVTSTREHPVGSVTGAGDASADATSLLAEPINSRVTTAKEAAKSDAKILFMCPL